MKHIEEDEKRRQKEREDDAAELKRIENDRTKKRLENDAAQKAWDEKYEKAKREFMQDPASQNESTTDVSLSFADSLMAFTTFTVGAFMMSALV